MSARGFSIVDVVPRSPAWVEARLGRLTGSRAADMLARAKSGKGESAGRMNLRVELALERLTGRPQGSTYVSPAMRAGIEREPAAARLYEAVTGDVVSRVGFLAHASLPAGVSLDGYVGDFEGIVELKAPQAATHLEYLRSGVVPADYHKQIVHALWLTGAAWCDWLSYSPEFPIGLQAKLVRVERNEQEIAAYALAVALFLKEVDAVVATVKGLPRVAA